ncbi:unnamed protein product [Ectocarpus sp. CCAP 1310/34]|nr:unnamed protein product [Ectocarpus sp. CCAP 1310/34]
MLTASALCYAVEPHATSHRTYQSSRSFSENGGSTPSTRFLVFAPPAKTTTLAPRNRTSKQVVAGSVVHSYV